MSTWTSLYIPLLKGLDLSKEASLGSDSLQFALNIDWGADGCVKGRPSRGAARQFIVRDPTTPYNTGVDYLAAADFDDTGFEPAGLVRLRDAAGERAALATHGRFFGLHGTSWVDEGPFGCMKVDRVIDYPNAFIIDSPSNSRETVAPDFSRSRTGAGAPATSIWSLLDSNGSLEREASTAGGSYYYPGMGTRNGTQTAALVIGNANQLNLVLRNDGATTLTVVQLAADARNPTDVGDAPCICPVPMGGGYHVVYRTTTANQFKVLGVNDLGSVTWTYTKATAETGVSGIWVDSSVGNIVAVAFTHDAGLTIRQLTLLGTSAGADINDATLFQGLDCVVGIEAEGKAWWAYRYGADEDLALGIAALGSGATAVTVQKTFPGAHILADASLRWSICHQPLRVGGRMYLTLCCATSAGYTGTWLTLDLTNWFTTAATATGPFAAPTIVARGPTASTYPHAQPAAASALTDGSGFVFPTLDWQQLTANVDGNLEGVQATCGLNRVLFSQPKSALLGETTVLSGSVPHMVARGQCVELGFPFLAGEPSIAVEPVNGSGAVADGTYSVAACWRWTDEAGQIHRSAPSVARSVTIANPVTDTIRVHVVNPWLTEKVHRLAIEVYCTATSPSTEYRLQATTTIFSTTEPATEIDLEVTPLTDTERLYTDGGVFGNYHVPADGGVAALGRRLWVADAKRVYASKLWAPGYGPEFSDEAAEDSPSLYVNLPAGAGRVVSLEALDDKLVVFCSRGVFLIQDGGPSNTGTGADFATPLRISDLAIAGPRASCLTDSGVVFCTSLDSTDTARGGPWLVDRQFTFTERQYLGRHAEKFFQQSDGGWVPEVAYSPERQQVYITTWRACDDSSAEAGGTDGVVVLDMRVGKWSVWDLQRASGYGDLRSVACVSGVLWALNDVPAPYNGVPGTDTGSGGEYPMEVHTSHLFADGRDGGGWSRVRSISPQEAADPQVAGSFRNLTITAVLDGSRVHSSGTILRVTPAPESTWPTLVVPAEWRLPVQKCATIQVKLSATPATTQWSAIRLDVAPLPHRAPARSRS